MKRFVFFAVLACAVPSEAQVLDLWPQGKVAFGVYAPSEGERGKPPVYTAAGAAAAAANPLYDYVFLNLEGAYDAAAVKVYGAGKSRWWPSPLCAAVEKLWRGLHLAYQVGTSPKTGRECS